MDNFAYTTYDSLANFDDGNCRYILELSDGNNFISFPVIPKAPDVTSLFNGLEDDSLISSVNFVTGMAECLFNTGEYWAGNLDEIQSDKGYWLNVTLEEGCDAIYEWEVDLVNDRTDECHTYYLSPGNNLISYVGEENRSISQALDIEHFNSFQFLIGSGLSAFNNSGPWTGNLHHLNKLNAYWLNIDDTYSLIEG